MRRRVWLIAFGVLLFLAASLWVAASNFSLSALDEPGRFETYAATQVKHALVGREARGIIAPPATDQSAEIGRMQFVARCAMCHGQDGRTPNDAGRWMYPRASDLGSPEVQHWSDGELFWIIKHGERLTGMPGFGKLLSDEEIWPLVHYVRRVGKAAR